LIKGASNTSPVTPTDPEARRRFEFAAAIEANRDQWGRPKVMLPDGSKETGYRRASSYGAPLEDTTALESWKRRQVARGLSRRGDLQLAVTRSEIGLDSSEYDEQKAAKKEIDALCEQAMEVVESGAKATIGTAEHHVFELVDLGKDPGHIPSQWLPDLNAYRELTRGFEVVGVERFVVEDSHQVAGTLDRAVRLRHDTEAPDGTVLEAGSVIIGDVKGLALTTPIPTPTGWSTMGALRVGDRVIGSDGRPCRVTTKSGIKRIGTYVVRFDDGSEVVCDPEHIWWVYGGKYGKGTPVRPVGIQEIRANLRDTYGKAWWRVPVSEPLELPQVDLPIDPYLLGCWLGDGSASAGRITKGRDLFEVLEADGHSLGVEGANHSDHCWTRTVIGLRTKLRQHDLLDNKHIPAVYLRASRSQRLRLLQGLLDTDGSWNKKRRRAVFSVTNKALALAVEELLATLGQRPQFNAVPHTGFTKTVTAYHVEFTPVNIVPFRLPRKADLVDPRPTTRARRRVIVSVEPGPDVLTACIAVDSPNRTYLCGDRMIPTHNTAQRMSFAGAKFAVQCWCYASGTPYDPIQKLRTPWEHEPPRQDWAVIFHVASGSGDARLYWVDLKAAALAAEAARECYEWRNRLGKAMISAAAENFIATAALATSMAELSAAYERAERQGVWSDELKARFTARKLELAAVNA